jgi:heme exporter protein C
MIAGISWWKWLSINLILYSIISGFLSAVPELPILHQSIRNLFFHVPMWFAMTVLLGASAFHSIRFLSKNDLRFDYLACSTASVATVFGIVGIITGMMWARVTWEQWWNNDPKQTVAAIGLLIYLSYFVLRNSIDDSDKKARISAVANVIFFFIFIPIIYIVPRLTDSLHPGNGGNPGFNAYDLDSRLRLVFYPAVLGWILFGFWMAQTTARLLLVNYKLKLVQANA